ncbi:UNVERIFIED_ORG: hypothetical protein J2W85_004085 [Ensifer adhaerens]|nr:hypothetical protein [Ensifer adhaerens]
MYFNVYSDTGSKIDGYLIPDGFSTKPRISVHSGEIDLGLFECDVFLAGPYNLKHHETGVVGFSLDETKIANLSRLDAIEIRDADSGFTFYRRLQPELHVLKRVFRLETQFAPHQELDRSLRPFFQFFSAGAERFGSETVRQMLEVSNQPSTYVSGRVMLKGVQQFITDDTIRITSLRDPFYELAIRIWSLATSKRRNLAFISDRDRILFGPAMSYFDKLNLADFDDVRRRIRSAPRDVLTLFESPFTQQLVASSPSDKVSRDAISNALDALSQFNIFDAKETDGRWAEDISMILGIDSDKVAFSAVRSPFLEFAEALREINLLEHVLENDLILFHFIQRAEKRATNAEFS